MRQTSPTDRCHDGAWDAKDWEAYFEERAAIREYDGGLSWPEAEETARQNVRNAAQIGIE
jgi:hypothetical protein